MTIEVIDVVKHGNRIEAVVIHNALSGKRGEPV